MSLTYIVDFGTDRTVAQVAADLLRVCQDMGELDDRTSAEAVAEHGVAWASEAWVRAMPALNPQERTIPGQGPITATVSTMFDSNGVPDIPAFLVSMFEAVSRLLDRIDGDAVLHRNGETVFLFRHGGHLVLNEDEDLWRNGELEVIKQSYTRDHLAFADS